jgi:hypothetical protein
MATKTSWATLQVEAPQPNRGGGTATPRKFDLQSGQVTWSWGSEPASASLTYVGTTPVSIGASLTLNIAGTKFFGVCKSDIPVQASGGHNRVLEFEDNRRWLDHDNVFGAFNLPDEKIVGGLRKKRYKHMLPVNWRSYTFTYTDAPYTARQILNYFLLSEFVKDSWGAVYHADQNFPVYDINFLSGDKLRNVLTRVSEAQGLVFTLMGGPFRLVWARKGQGTLPTFTHHVLNTDKTAYTGTSYVSVFPLASDNRTDGFALSGHATQIQVLGDRNLYQVHDIPLIPDWQTAWEQFYDFNLFIEEIYRIGRTDRAVTLSNDAGSHTFPAGTLFRDIGLFQIGGEPIDPEQIISRQLARAEALDITVLEYANLKGNAAFEDFRKFSTRSRLDMPAALYIKQILFRCFKFATNFAILNRDGASVPLASLEIASKMLAKVTHDPITGFMDWDETENADGNGYAVVRGYQVGHDLFKTIKPHRFDINQWNDSQNVWQHIEFQVDDSGEEDSKFILFDEPVIRSCDLVDMVDGYAVLKAVPTFSVTPVRIAITFAAEQFFYSQGTEFKHELHSEPGLNGEHLSSYLEPALPVEIPYTDGKTATVKASEVAASLLNLQSVFKRGRYTRRITRNANGTYPAGATLNGLIDRVTITFGPHEANEEVELTSEAPRRVFVPERDLDRGALMKALLPGQAQLRHESNVARLTAAALRSGSRSRKAFTDAFSLIFGSDDPVELLPVEGNGATTVNLPVGTPLQKKPVEMVGAVRTNTRYALPTAATDLHTEFGGVVVANNAPVTRDGSSVVAQRSGDLLVRVHGPCKVGDLVYLVSAADYLGTSKTKSDAVGKALQEVKEDEVKLTLVRTSSSAAAVSGGFPFEIVKLTDTTAMVAPGYCITELDQAHFLKIFGLGKPFTIHQGDYVFLETYFDVNGLPLYGFIACGSELDGDLPTPRTLYKAILKTDVDAEIAALDSFFADHVVFNPTRSDQLEGEIAIKLEAFKTASGNNRFYKSFIIIGYATVGANSTGLEMLDGLTKFRVIQSVNMHLMLQEFCAKNIPCSVPMPFFAPWLAVEATPTATPANPTSTQTFTLQMPDPTHPDAIIYYTIDGTTPTEASTVYGPTAIGPYPTGTHIKFFAAEYGYWYSPVVEIVIP